ncbi:hypothetical protein MMC13_000771 [Lambiella insularis]|nr:hypothetical protein [Lambiella insularis]
MAPRGRPRSTTSGDAAVDHRRIVDRERQARRRAHLRDLARQRTQDQAKRPPLTPIQQRQNNLIIRRSTGEIEEDVEPTSLTKKTIAVDEHQRIYHPAYRARTTSTLPLSSTAAAFYSRPADKFISSSSALHQPSPPAPATTAGVTIPRTNQPSSSSGASLPARPPVPLFPRRPRSPTQASSSRIVSHPTATSSAGQTVKPQFTRATSSTPSDTSSTQTRKTIHEFFRPYLKTAAEGKDSPRGPSFSPLSDTSTPRPRPQTPLRPSSHPHTPLRPSFSPLTQSSTTRRPSYSPLTQASSRISYSPGPIGGDDDEEADNERSIPPQEEEDQEESDDQEAPAHNRALRRIPEDTDGEDAPADRPLSPDSDPNSPPPNDDDGSPRRSPSPTDNPGSPHPPSDPSSPFNPDSEREEDDEPEISDTEYVLNKVREFFYTPLQGCSTERHATAQNRHNNLVHDDEHYGLDDIANEPNMPTVLDTPSLMTPAELEA